MAAAQSVKIMQIQVKNLQLLFTSNSWMVLPPAFSDVELTVVLNLDLHGVIHCVLLINWTLSIAVWENMSDVNVTGFWEKKQITLSEIY